GGLTHPARRPVLPDVWPTDMMIEASGTVSSLRSRGTVGSIHHDTVDSIPRALPYLAGIAAVQRWTRGHPTPPGQAAEPAVFSRGSRPKNDCARRIYHRAGRGRAGSHQPDRHDVRRPGADLGHGKP